MNSYLPENVVNNSPTRVLLCYFGVTTQHAHVLAVSLEGFIVPEENQCLYMNSIEYLSHLLVYKTQPPRSENFKHHIAHIPLLAQNFLYFYNK